jgi:hypothetical protein
VREADVGEDICTVVVADEVDEITLDELLPIAVTDDDMVVT